MRPIFRGSPGAGPSCGVHWLLLDVHVVQAFEHHELQQPADRALPDQVVFVRIQKVRLPELDDSMTSPVESEPQKKHLYILLGASGGLWSS